MNLIKQINDRLYPETDPVKIAIAEVRQSPRDEMKRIVSYWRTAGKDLDTDELRVQVSNDLEMLEYGPEEVDQMTTQIIKRLGREL